MRAMTKPLPTPLLSDEEMEMLCKEDYPDSSERWDDPSLGCWDDGAMTVRRWYEAKIASGELMVVKTVHLTMHAVGKRDGSEACFKCPNCMRAYQGISSELIGPPRPKPGEFCRCGAKIVE